MPVILVYWMVLEEKKGKKGTMRVKCVSYSAKIRKSMGYPRKGCTCVYSAPSTPEAY